VENPPFKPGNPVTLLNDVFERNSTYDGPAGSEPNSWEDRAGGAVSIGATGPVEITGCTFTGNRTGDTPAVRNTFGAFPSFGGAISSQAPLTITDSTFTNNHTGAGGSGGAIASEGPGAALTLVHDTFDGNHSQDGFGGAVHVGQAALSVESSTFSGNWTDKDNFGAAIQADADVSIAGSTFTGNHSGSAGAAIWWSSMPGGDHVLTVADSTFTGNSGIVAQACQSGPCSDRVAISGSTFGGNSGRPAITLNATGPGADPHSDRGLLDVVNSTITAEATTDWVGGGIDVGQSTARVTNVTIVIDGAASAGITAEAGAEVTVANTIVAGSQPHCVTNTGGAGGTIVDAGGNLMTPSVVGCPAGFLVGDPALGALADNGGPTWTMALGAGSAAIDKGVDALCPATDQRGLGFPRPVGAGCDIGAFEVQQP